MLLAAKEMTINDLVEKIEPKTSAQNIGAKLKRDNLSEKDLHAVAKACSVKFEGYFLFEDNRTI